MASDYIVIEKRLLKSEAFRGLNGIAKTVYFDFCLKCQLAKIKTPAGRKKEWVITNNGELIFSYAEALAKGITRPRFKRALAELVEHGFIDVEHPGSGGVKGDKSKYAISERWRTWGTDTFKKITMPKDDRKGRGFALYWQKKSSNIGNKNVTPSSNENVTSLRKKTNMV
jgi:hypothetical protein